jgi:uncharacterized protein YndB with AHSA1/START domain
MADRNFTATFTVHQTPAEAFAAITNARGWWSEEIEGHAGTLGAEFDYHFKDVHRCRIRVTELVPGEKVAWRVLDNHFSFTQDKSEWKATEIVFAISRQGDETRIHFTHLGLVPEYECYDACSEGWSHYIKTSLRELITTGKGRPNLGQAMTETERALTS